LLSTDKSRDYEICSRAEVEYLEHIAMEIEHKNLDKTIFGLETFFDTQGNDEEDDTLLILQVLLRSMH
jgi:hypothetical protein